MKAFRILSGLVIFFLAVSCGSPALPPGQELTYEENATLNASIHPASPAASPASGCVIATTPAPPGLELTYQEDLAIHPPAPCNLQAARTANGIQLRWDLPPTVPVPHGYSDEVLYYNIYRRTEISEFVFLGSSTALFFVDQTALGDLQYTYTVTAMHANQIESVRAAQVTPAP